MSIYFESIELDKSPRNYMAYRLFNGEIVLLIHDRKKDFIEVLTHELTEATIHCLMEDLGFSGDSTMNMNEIPFHVNHIVTLFAYPYETIAKIHELKGIFIL